MPLEEFRERGGRTKFGFATLAIMRSGTLGLNSQAYSLLGSPDRVVLAYDKDEGIIGVRAAVKDEAFSYPVRKATAETWVIPGRAFFRYYDVTVDATVKFRAAFEEPYILIRLDDSPVHKEQRGKEGRE